MEEKNDRKKTHWLRHPTQKPNEKTRTEAKKHQENLTKPPGSLGHLETIATDFAAWQEQPIPHLKTIGLAVFAADHGIARQGVSAFPQAVTAQMIANFATGGAAVAVLAREAGMALQVIDLGTVGPSLDQPGVIALDLAPGTADFTEAPAMTEEAFAPALAAGAAQVAADQDLFVGGEMGIGNTTSAAAVWAGLDGLTGAATVGRGTGVDAAGLAHKADVVDAGLALHGAAWAGLDTADRAECVLRCVGGLEIAALVGAYIAAAQRGVPVLVDGFITTVAALVAVRINPGVADWLIYAHRSAEAGHARLLATLGARALLDLNMRLGEGSGAMMAVSVIRNALALHAKMATFESAGIG